jgi:hypothetical protein
MALELHAFDMIFNDYFHFQGGFRLQVLDFLERPLLDLTPSVAGSDFVREDAT